MTATITTMSGKKVYVNNITSMVHIGTHTYEFTQRISPTNDIGRIRVVEVAHIVMTYKCQCHNDIYERLDVPLEYQNRET